jgi:hypothetical protein
LDKSEWADLKSKFLTSNRGGKNKLPKAFTEKGLYMLATILKSKQATETTIDIIETFAKMRELSRTTAVLPGKITWQLRTAKELLDTEAITPVEFEQVKRSLLVQKRCYPCLKATSFQV